MIQLYTKLTESQKNRYNQRYSYLAYELRNVYESKTSTANDVFSLGFIFQFISDSDNNFLLHLLKQMITDFPFFLIDRMEISLKLCDQILRVS